jgi:hypothetical protein
MVRQRASCGESVYQDLGAPYPNASRTMSRSGPGRATSWPDPARIAFATRRKASRCSSAPGSSSHCTAAAAKVGSKGPRLLSRIQASTKTWADRMIDSSRDWGLAMGRYLWWPGGALPHEDTQLVSRRSSSALRSPLCDQIVEHGKQGADLRLPSEPIARPRAPTQSWSRPGESKRILTRP